MSDRTQELKNLRKLAIACKEYVDKSIDNLKWELGTYDLGVESDNTSALVKTMPSGTILANANKIYGASEVSENLAVLTDTAQTTDRGVTYSISNGTINVGDSANANLTITLSSLTYFNGTYTLKNFGSQALSNRVYFVFLLDGQWSTVITVKSDSGTITLNGNYVYGIAITSGTSVSGTIKPILVKGSTAPTEFKVGFSGIHNLELSGLKVEGANKLDYANRIENKTINDSGVMTENSNYYVIDNVNLLPNTTYSWNATVSGSINQYDSRNNYLGKIPYTQGTSFTTLSNAKYFKFDSNKVFTNPMLNVGSTALDYTPYITPTTKTIDLSTILYNGSPLFEGNAIKKIGTAVDNIQPYKAHKEIGKKVLNGTEDWETQWQYDSTNDIGGYRTTISDIKQITSESTVGNILTDKLDVVSQLSLAQNSNTGICVRANTSNIIIKIVGKNCSTVEAFKTYLQSNPIILYYELATPIEVSIDWSATLRNIQGYPNGSIIAENTHNMATTSEIDYLVEEVKA